MSKLPKQLRAVYTFKDGSTDSLPLSRVRQDMMREVAFFREAAKSEADPVEKMKMELHAQRIEVRLAEEFNTLSTAYYRATKRGRLAQAAVEDRRSALLEAMRLAGMTDAEIAATYDLRHLQRYIPDFILEVYGPAKKRETLRTDLRAIQEALNHI